MGSRVTCCSNFEWILQRCRKIFTGRYQAHIALTAPRNLSTANTCLLVLWSTVICRTLKKKWWLIWLPSAFLCDWQYFCKMLDQLLETSKFMLEINSTLLASFSRFVNSLWFAWLLSKAVFCWSYYLQVQALHKAEQAQGCTHLSCLLPWEMWVTAVVGTADPHTTSPDHRPQASTTLPNLGCGVSLVGLNTSLYFHGLLPNETQLSN